MSFLWKFYSSVCIPDQRNSHHSIFLQKTANLVGELPPVSSYSELKDVPIRKEFLQAQKFRRPPPGSVRNRGASNRRKRKSRRRQETDSEADEEEEDEDDEESLESEEDVRYEEEENDKDDNEDIMVKDENVDAEGTEEKEDEVASIAATDEEEEAAYSYAKVELDTHHQSPHKRKRTKAATDTRERANRSTKPMPPRTTKTKKKPPISLRTTMQTWWNGVVDTPFLFYRPLPLHEYVHARQGIRQITP